MPRPIRRVNTPAFGTEVVMPGGVAVVPDWWDPNVAGLCVVGAYRAINTPGSPWAGGPANYAQSRVNQANPGVNDLTESNGAVPWNLLFGWQFVAGNQQTLGSGWQTTQNWTVLVQFNNVVGAWTLMCSDSDSLLPAPMVFRMQPNSGNHLYYHGFGIVTVPPPVLTGNMAIAGLACYLNGVFEGNIAAIVFTSDGQYRVGGRDPPANWITVDIWAFAVYNCVLTGPQVLAVATAMSQL